MSICPRPQNQRSRSLSWAGQAGLTQRMYGVSASRLDLRAAPGHLVGALDRLRILRPLLGHDFDDVRDDFAGPLDDDRVAEVQVEALDLVDVVQRDVGDGDAADEDRLERRRRA